MSAKILSPPKQLLKIHFSFLLTALLKLKDVSEGFGCQCYLFPKSLLALKGFFPPFPKWTSLKVIMDLAIWHRWYHLWNSTWHLQPSLPNCELCVQWVLGKCNWLNKFPRNKGGAWLVGEVQASYVYNLLLLNVGLLVWDITPIGRWQYLGTGKGFCRHNLGSQSVDFLVKKGELLEQRGDWVV